MGICGMDAGKRRSSPPNPSRPAASWQQQQQQQAQSGSVRHQQQSTQLQAPSQSQSNDLKVINITLPCPVVVSLRPTWSVLTSGLQQEHKKPLQFCLHILPLHGCGIYIIHATYDVCQDPQTVSWRTSVSIGRSLRWYTILPQGRAGTPKFSMYSGSKALVNKQMLCPLGTRCCTLLVHQQTQTQPPSRPR